MASRELSRRAVAERARERLGALAATPEPDVRRRPGPESPETLEPEGSDTATTRVEPLDTDADDLVARLRSGALSAAAVAYTAAHGHPLEHPDPWQAPPRRRWALGRRSAVVVGLALLAVAVVVVLRGWSDAPSDVVPFGAAGSVEDATDPFAEPLGSLVVHVVGEVGSPGVVELEPGARVAEAVDAAGGATRKADLGALNLARPVEDGEQVVVPRKGKVTGGGDGTASTTPSDTRVDLNAADATLLETLPGIGPVLAGRIVAWRDEHGSFSSVAELQEVSGIGPSLFARLEGLVRV